MSSSVDVRLSKIPGASGVPEITLDRADDFEPPEQSETEEDPDNTATGDGGDGFPIRGSGPGSKNC